jgi:hypothetical protein
MHHKKRIVKMGYMGGGDCNKTCNSHSFFIYFRKAKRLSVRGIFCVCVVLGRGAMAAQAKLTLPHATPSDATRTFTGYEF